MKKMQHFIIILIILILSFGFFAIMYFHANEKIQKSIEYNLSNNTNYVVSNETIKLYNEYTLEYVKAISSNIINTFTFWFSFLSIIMVAFTILSIYTNSNVKSEIQEHVIDMQRNIQKEIDTSNYMLQSYKYYNNGEYIRSVSYCDAALESSVNMAQIYFDKALSLTSIKNENTSLARAISLYTKSIFQLNAELKNIKKKGENLEKHKIINDNIALSYYNRGGCYFESKEYDKAMKDYDRSEKQYKKSYRCNDIDLAKIHHSKAICYLGKKEDENALNEFLKVEEIHKKNNNINIYYGFFNETFKYLSSNYLNEVIKFDEKIAEDKEYKKIEENILGKIKKIDSKNLSDELKKLNEALKVYDKIEPITREDKIDIFLNKAIIYIVLHKKSQINDINIKDNAKYILNFIKNVTSDKYYYNYLSEVLLNILENKISKNEIIQEIENPDNILNMEIYLIGKSDYVKLNTLLKYKELIKKLMELK